MKKITPIRLLILSCLLFSCHSKTEKKQPTIYNYNQNYKFDDDEIQKRNTKDYLKKIESNKEKRNKVGVKK